jgi:hypothetical protein
MQSNAHPQDRLLKKLIAAGLKERDRKRDEEEPRRARCGEQRRPKKSFFSFSSRSRRTKKIKKEETFLRPVSRR